MKVAAFTKEPFISDHKGVSLVLLTVRSVQTAGSSQKPTLVNSS